MPKKFKILEATRKHRKEMMELNIKCLPENYDLSFWEKEIKHHNSYILYNMSVAVGYILVGKNGCIISFAILPEFRKQGWGEKLMTIAIQKLKEKNVEKSSLHVRTDNESALKLYLKIGYVVAFTDKEYYNDGSDAHVMVYKLK
jgi:ribosomal-protein-alanine N-acetyltransferase